LAGGYPMGGFSPAWFLAAGIGVLGITEGLLRDSWKPWARVFAVPLSIVLFLVGIVGLGFDFHAAYELRWPVASRVESPAPLATLQAPPALTPAKPAESAYSDMSDAALREVTIAHVKTVEARLEQTQRMVDMSQENYSQPLPPGSTLTPEQRSKNHFQFLNSQFEGEMFFYKQSYMAKSIGLMLELRKREPDYAAQMDAMDLEDLNRKYHDPFNRFDIQAVANDLDTMAQRLP
jgi:hypothetical protein